MSGRLEGGEAAVADGHHLARGAISNALVLVAANFRAVFTFLIARLLGEAGLGRFSLAFAFVDLASKVATLGLDTAIVPLVARAEAAAERNGSRRLLFRSVRLGIVASVSLVVLGIPVVGWLAEHRQLDAFTRGGTLMLLALPGIAVARICTGVSRGLLAMRSELYSRGFAETWITIGVFIFAIALGVRDLAPTLAVVAGSTGGAIVAFVLALQVVGLRRAPERDRDAASTAKELVVPATPALLRYTLPVAGSSLLNTLALRIDVLLLGAFVSRAPGVTLESFGVFCAAVEVAGGMRKVRQVFDPIFAPVVATRHHVGQWADLRDTVESPGRWVLAGQLPLVGFLVLAGGAVLSIYGAGFRQGASWLALLAIAHAVNSFAGLVETLLMIERPALNFMNAIVTVTVQLLAGLILIPVLGVMGAVLAMAAGFSVQGVLRFVELRHVFGWSWPWRSLVRPLAAFAIAFAPCALLRSLGGGNFELPAGVLFLVLYAAAWYRLGADPADRIIWQRLLKRR